MVRMTVGFFIVAFEVWLCFRYLPKREGNGSLPYAVNYFIPCWIFLAVSAGACDFFFIELPSPEDQSFFGWYAEGMSYLITAVFMFTIVLAKAAHAMRHKFKNSSKQLFGKNLTTSLIPLPLFSMILERVFKGIKKRIRRLCDDALFLCKGIELIR